MDKDNIMIDSPKRISPGTEREAFALYRDGKIAKEAYYSLIAPGINYRLSYIDSNWRTCLISDYYKTLLTFIHEDNEELSMELMHLYPMVYSKIDEPWTDWAKLLV